MSDQAAQQLRAQLPTNWLSLTFSSFAALRKSNTDNDLGFLTVIRTDNEDMRETVAFEPEMDKFSELAKLLVQPALRMLTVVVQGQKNETGYMEIVKDNGVKYLGNGGKIMAIDLSADSSISSANSLAPEFTLRSEEQDGCCAVEILHGGNVVSSAKATAQSGIATFDGMFTEPSFQRRGLATIVMRHLIQWAVTNGAALGLLNASPPGQTLYSSLGWTGLYDVMSFGGQPAIDFHERMRRKWAKYNEKK